MSIPVYGATNSGDAATLAAAMAQFDTIDTFIQDLGRVMSQLKDERDKEKATARLENLRRQMLVVLGKENEYYVIPPPATTATTLPTMAREGAKISLNSAFSPKNPQQ